MSAYNPNGPTQRYLKADVKHGSKLGVVPLTTPENGKWRGKFAASDIPFVDPNFSQSQPFIPFGTNNQYPQELLALCSSSVHNAILQTKKDYVVGEGLVYSEEDQALHDFLSTLCAGYDSTELISRTALDLVTFGGFAWQIQFNHAAYVQRIYHTPFARVRCGRPPEPNLPEVSHYYLHPDWGRNYPRIPAHIIPAVNWAHVPAGGVAMLYYSDYNQLFDFYPLPDYYGATRYIDLDIQISEFHANNVANGVVPTMMIGLPGDAPSPEEQQQFIDEIMHRMQGPGNAGRAFVAWGGSNADGAGNLPQITPVTNSNNADIYNALDAITTQKIISGHRLNSPTLAGLAGQGGLGGNASEIATAAEFFYNNVARKYQEKIMGQLRKVLRHNRLSEEVDLGYSLPVINRSAEVNEVLTPNERRENAGYEPLDELEHLLPNVAATAPAVAGPVAEAPPENPADDLVEPTDEQAP